MRRRLVALAASLAALLAAAWVARASDSDEEALRHRVQRFYVLSYLNRHGEMWELFTPELQARMGGDKRAYIASARQEGFELYSSRIEHVEMRKADIAVVDVALQVQMPGALQVTWRRHRMAWRLTDDGWRYAGSLDITHEEKDVTGADLVANPKPEASNASSDEGELLPQRSRLDPRSRLTAAPSIETEEKPSPEPATPTYTADGSIEGHRWDLVAIPPEGQARPPEPPPAPSAPAPAAASAPEPPRRAGEWLPPSRAAVAVEAPPPEAEPAAEASEAGKPGKPTKSTSMPGDSESLDELVRRVADTSGVKRLRALEKLRHVTDPRFPALAVQALPDAPPGSQVVLLERLSVLGSSKDADAVRKLVTSDVPAVREAAVAAIGELGGESDARTIVRLLKDETADGPRTAELRALGKLGGGGADGRMMLAQALGDPKLDDEPRTAAALSIADARVTEGEAAVVHVLAARGPYNSFLACIAAAASLKSPATLQVLDQLAQAGGYVASAQQQQPVRLLALRALCAAEVKGAGARLAQEMMLSGDEASPTDVDRIAETGEIVALAGLLQHPSVLVRVRAADLLGRSLDDPEQAKRAVAFVDLAITEAADTRALRALKEARDRLTATAAKTKQ